MDEKKTVVHLHNGILHSREKQVAPTICDSMDGTGEYYAKWNKPGGEGQIPYDLTFNWNIINEKKKSKPNITRDIEIRSNLTIARGETGGDSGEGFSGSTIKDKETKPRGRVEAKKGGGFAGGWGDCSGEKQTTVIEQQ